MYIKMLVERDIENGQRFVDALQNLMPVDAAFWSNDEETNKWRLKIVSPTRSRDPHLAYGLVDQALAESRVALSSENISFVSPVSLEYKRVRRAVEDSRSGIPAPPGLDFGDSYVYVMN
jgi:hypothetical protein